jgi:hypothetical protein
MCLVTMEDITKEEGNYGSFTLSLPLFWVIDSHTVFAKKVSVSLIPSLVVLDAWLLYYVLCYTTYNVLYTVVEFQGYPSMTWKPAMFEQSVVQQLLDSQFHTFVERVKTTDCQAELKRLLDVGPPVHVSDKMGFPLEEGDTHVINLWYASDNQERSATLEGAVQGEERQALWEELKQFIVVEGKEKGDDDDDDDDDNDKS